ncbi:MAG: Cys-Gln thioester bond-forming surface protein [Ignavibacteria bacterium]|nr:Cys-Gln thioester bond-forming surface protein [Ignavibacteria bacterium]
MKRQILFCVFLALIFIFTKSVSAQCIGGLTEVHIISLGTGTNVTFTDPLTNSSKTTFAGTVNSTMDGNAMPVYCVDLHRNVTMGDNTYTDTCDYVESRIQYLLNHYYPYKTSYPGKLSDNEKEAAAVQMAIWKYTDNVNSNTITSSNTIKNRALDIIADADVNGNATEPIITFSIEASADPDAFFVKTTDENGVGIVVNNISLSISEGSLSTNTVNTNSSGISPDVFVSGTNTGIITATARMLYSQGRKIHSTTLTRQSLSIAYPVYGMMAVTADWGALPVELTSFTASSSDRDVTLNWATSSELNNSHFNIERKSENAAGWVNAGSVSGNGTSNATHTYSFKDKNLSSGKYNYRLKQTDFNGNFEYFNLSSEVEIGSPSKYDLSQNYPNPFNPSTKINYSVAKSGFVSIKVFDNLGRQVATLVNENKSEGFYSADFSGLNLTSGLYFYKMEANSFVKVMKMTLVK